MTDPYESEDLSNELNLLHEKIEELEKLKRKGELIEEESELKTQLLDAATDSIFLIEVDGNLSLV